MLHLPNISAGFFRDNILCCCHLEAPIVEPSAIIVLVSPYQHISQAALANLIREVWVKLIYQ